MEKNPDAFAARRSRVSAWIKERNIAAALFEDREGNRDPSIRYLTGQPGDSLLVVTDAGRGVLVSWDVNMARKYGSADEILAYGDFDRKATRALAGVLEREGVRRGSAVELPSATPYPDIFGTWKTGSPSTPVQEDGRIRVRPGNARGQGPVRTGDLPPRLRDDGRARRRPGRRRALGKTLLGNGRGLFIERECRALGCEGVGFETLAAGPARSFGIHAFPPYNGGAVRDRGHEHPGFRHRPGGVYHRRHHDLRAGEGVRGSRDHDRSRGAGLPGGRGHDTPGLASIEIARRVDDIFAKEGFKMPHGLGHGIGLQAHEAPAVRSREDNAWVLAPGHIVHPGPGLYDPEWGGCAWKTTSW
jgi:Xaa-Pro dipeptidase